MTVTLRSATVALTLFAMLAWGPSPSTSSTLDVPPDGPPVVRIWTPEDQASQALPAETQPRSLPAADFERLLESSRWGWRRERSGSVARLLRIDHFAKLRDGALEGRSVLQARTPGGLELTPWSPALTSPLPFARNASDGSLRIQTDPRPAASSIQTLEIPWIVQAKRGSDSGRFEFELPNQGLGAFILDLPDGDEPDAGARALVRELGGEPGRSLWRIGDPRGRIELRVRSTAHRRRVAGMGGPIRIEIQASHALWTADWTFDPGAVAARGCALELDPRLSVLDVSGAAVSGFETVLDPAKTGQRLTIRFADRQTDPVAIRIRASLPVPAEGEWLAPWSRPADAIGLPSQTTIVIDKERELSGCVEEAGWRAPLTGPQRLALDPAGNSLVLAFYPLRPGPVARLELRRAGAAMRARVRGTAIFGRVASTLTAVVSWSRVQPRDPLLLDLSPGWTPTRIEEDGGPADCVWARRDAKDVSPGWTRWAIWFPAPRVQGANGGEAAADLELRIDAKRDGSAAQGLWTLPRLRPRGASMTDESWNALCDPDLSLRPIAATGLVWTIPPSPGAFSARLPSELAWRWEAEPGEAVIDRLWRPARIDAESAIRIATEPGKAAVDASITLQLGERRLKALPMQWLGAPSAPRPVSWRCRLDSGAEWRLSPKASAPGSHQNLGLASSDQGPGEVLEFPLPVSGRIVLSARWDVPFVEPAPTDWPIPSLPSSIRASGRVAVASNPLALLDLQTEEMWPVDFPSRDAARAWLSTGPETSPGPWTLRHFAYSSPAARISGSSRAPDLEPPSGLIQEAILRSQVRAEGPIRHALSLIVARGTARSLDVVLPDGSLLERAERDGQALAPLSNRGAPGEGQAFAIPLPPPPRGDAICRVELRYSAPPPPRRLGGASERRQPERPAFSLPCAAFCWETASVSPRFVRETGPALIASAPLTERWNWRGDPQSIARRQSFERWLSAPASAPRFSSSASSSTGSASEEVTLGQWLRAWDADAHPLIVDRSALLAAGWGPGSIVPAQETDTETETDAEAAPTVGAKLEQWGLSASPLGDAILIASRREAPALDRDFLGWPALSEQALLRGHDRSDRFQTVERWLGEPTLATSRDPNPPMASDGGGDGWIRQRFHALGWPKEGTGIIVADPGEAASWAWVIASAILIAAVAWRGLPWMRRVCGLIAALASLLTILALIWGMDAGWTTGVWAGGLAAASYWWGRSVRLRRQRSDIYRRRMARGRSHRRIVRPPSSIRPRAAAPASSSLLEGPGLGATLWLVAAGSVLWLFQAQADAPVLAPGPGDDEPIRAVIPFDPLEGPKSPPERVIIRKADEDRLRRWSNAASRLSATLAAVSARHEIEVANPDAEETVVRSEFELIHEADAEAIAGDGEGLASDWDFPIGSARGVTAEWDGRPIPVLVLPGGAVGRVRALGPGRHRLILKRTVARTSDDSGRSLRLPINPQGAARVSVTGNGGAVEFLSAVGPSSGEREVLLGPSRTIELRWPKIVGAPVESRAGTEVLALWDALPGGDRLHVRIGLRSPKPLDRLRFRLPEGALARSLSPRVRLETRTSGQGRAEWIAEFAQPISAGTFDLRIWAPLPVAEAGAGAGIDRRPRVPPLLELPDAASSSGALAIRRLSSWDGGLKPAFGPGVDGLADEEYAEAWGDDLPSATDVDHALTLAGAVRFDGLERWKSLAVAAAPAVSRPTARAEMTLTFEAGRLGVATDAEWSDPDRRAFEAEVELPPELRIATARGDGLTSWSQPRPGLLRLRFDGEPLASRRLHWEGKISLMESDANPPQGQQKTSIPWPRWLNADEKPGTLTIDAHEALGLRSPFSEPEATPETIQLAATERRSAGPMGSLLHGEYRILAPHRLPKLRWRAAGSRIAVLARSCLTLTRDQAIWTAMARYRTSGGPLARCALTMPSGWAPDRLDVGDEECAAKRQTDDRGHAIWTIDLKTPVWGEFEIRFEVKRPWINGEPLDFPDLAPLGPGSAGIYLAVVDASGGAVRIEREEGLRKVESRSLDWSEIAAVPAIEPMAIYEARQSDWRLELQRDPSAIAPVSPGDVRAASTLADLALTLGPRGEAWGEATYWLQPQTDDSWLWLRAPEAHRLEIVWAAVDGAIVETVREPRGRWRIPILQPNPNRSRGSGQVRRRTRAPEVRVIWRTRPGAEAGSSANESAIGPGIISLLPLLTPDQPKVRNLITVYARNDVDVQALTPDSRKIPAGWHEIELLERSANRIVDDLESQPQRGEAAANPSARRTLSLKRLSDGARDIERLARRVPVFVKGDLADRIEKQLTDRVSQARAGIDRALKDQGLPSWDWERGVFHGVAATVPEMDLDAEADADPDADSGPGLEGSPTWGLRRLGDPIHFEAVSEHDGHPPRIARRHRSDLSAAESMTLGSRTDHPAIGWARTGLILVLWISAAGLAAALRGGRSGRGEPWVLLGLAALTGSGALLTALGGLAALGIAVGLALAGWISIRIPSPGSVLGANVGGG